MLDLFSKQFELIVRTIDDFKSLTLKKLDNMSNNSINNAPLNTSTCTSTIADALNKLTAQVSQLEIKIDGQATKRDVLHSVQAKLLHKNDALK